MPPEVGTGSESWGQMALMEIGGRVSVTKLVRPEAERIKLLTGW